MRVDGRCGCHRVRVEGGGEGGHGGQGHAAPMHDAAAHVKSSATGVSAPKMYVGSKISRLGTSTRGSTRKRVSSTPA